jgi:DNA-binding response OmpR family regulator
MKVIIIEDEKSIADPIIRVLGRKGFIVDYASDGIAAEKLLLSNEYDCIVLDLNLPSRDGIEITKKLRDSGSVVPILMLTARSQMYDKLTGFESGADDYLTKPFDLQELLARINALIKRTCLNRQPQLCCGDLVLDSAQNLLKHKDNKFTVVLSNKETAMLEYLIRNKGNVVSAETLLEHVWDRNVNIFTDTVKTHIKTLRKKLGDRENLLKTIKGKGYLITD